jgi:hypothetical protein
VFMRVLIGLLRKGIIDVLEDGSGVMCVSCLDFSIRWRMRTQFSHELRLCEDCPA